MQQRHLIAATDVKTNAFVVRHFDKSNFMLFSLSRDC